MGESSGTPNPGLEEHTRRGTEMQRHSLTHEGSYGWIRLTPSWAQCEQDRGGVKTSDQKRLRGHATPSQISGTPKL